MIPIIWSAVLALPPSPAAMTMPSAQAIERSAVMVISREIRSTTAHAGMRPIGTIHTSVAATMSLSASGSRNLPSTLTRPCRRASQPSSRSVIAASA